MKPTRTATATLVALAVCPLGARGQAASDTARADTVYSVEEIAVTVARPTTAAGGASSVTVAIDSLRVGPAPTLEEVLRRLPLIQIRSNSRGEAQPKLRGIGSRRVAVLVDGIPLTLGWDDRTDLSIIPLNAAYRITMTRGLSSVLDGPNAVGGVVRVGMAAGEDLLDPVPLQFAASVDDFGNSQFALGLATLQRGVAGDLSLRAGGGYRDRDAFPLPADVPPAAFADGERLNSDFRQANGYLVAGYRAHSGSWLSLTSFGHRSRKGVPPELHVEEPRLWRYPNVSRWVTALSAGSGWKDTPLGWGDIEVSVGIDLGETDIESYATLAYDSVVEKELGDDRTLSLRLLGDHTVGSGVLRSAFTIAETRHVETLEPEGGRSIFRQRLWSLGFELEQAVGGVPAGGARGRVSAGLSIDHASTPETGGREPRDPITEWGARIGGTLALGAGRTLLHGGLSRRVRFPALRELYSGALGRFVVNPDLDPEKLFVTELGVTGGLDAFEYQVVGFHQRMTEGIVRVGLGNSQFQRQNRDELLATGLELLASYGWRQLYVAGDVTLQDTQLNDPTAPELQRRPEYTPWISGSGTVSGPVGFGIKGRARLFHQGAQYCVNPDSGADEKLSAQAWLNLEMSRTFSLRDSGAGRLLGLVLSLDNATDAEAFDQCGLPRPGRLLRLGLRVY